MTKVVALLLLASLPAPAPAEPQPAVCAAPAAEPADQAARSGGTKLKPTMGDVKTSASQNGQVLREAAPGTCAHAINTKGTGMAGRSADPNAACGDSAAPAPAAKGGGVVKTSASQNGQTLREACPAPAAPPRTE